MGLFGTLSIFFLLSCLTLFLCLLWRRDAKKEKLPPGPTPLPWLGNLLQVDVKNMLTSFQRLQEKYGPVFTVYMGSQPVVVLCGYEAIKEALVDNAEAFGARGSMQALDDNIVKYGVISTNGERWRQLRRFTLSTLRDLGMGKRGIERQIQEEAQFLVDALWKTRGHPFDPVMHLRQAVFNISTSVVFGERFEYEDEKIISLINQNNQSARLFFSPRGQAMTFFPGLKRILPRSHHKLSLFRSTLRNFITQRIQAHRESFDPNCLRNFMDYFLGKMEQEKDNPASEFHEDNLAVTAVNLLSAGTESTANTLQYGLLILLRYPEIEAKIQEEIDRVIGRNRKPSMEDRMQMPYTDAVVHEIQRFGDVSPLPPPRLVTADTQFRGYTIPKGTTAMVFLTSALQDPHQFETPMKFNPAHFLDGNGAFKKSKAFLPFSAGKRACLGESLARMELFILFTTILQNFSLKPPQGHEEIDILPEVHGSAKYPPPFRLSVVPR